ncbi:hypothetical protein OIU78_005510 [Salix suchowensis]|nr:hypothetical protein OIU78_005510 [Salix suchowensis]
MMVKVNCRNRWTLLVEPVVVMSFFVAWSPAWLGLLPWFRFLEFTGSRGRYVKVNVKVKERSWEVSEIRISHGSLKMSRTRLRPSPDPAIKRRLERGFHQFDIRGSAYGLLAAHPLAPLVSLHHLGGLEPLFPNHNHEDSLKSINHAYRADPPRIFQQTFCHDSKRKWSISIAWGYTVQLHPLLLPAKDLQTPVQTFKTWRSWSDGPFTFNTRPMEPDLCKRPVVFMLEQVREGGFNGSLSSYKRIEPGPGKTCKTTRYAQAMSVQRILVSSLKMDPDYWKKSYVQAPRRFCCELMNKGIMKNNSLQLRIRKCRNPESITSGLD